uniref:CobW C-terminal domain-containing protein n=1 Tax=Pseudo-nitzschia australis TaxID=44445 RepID=A0A7S4ASH4_9STRA|mmetsp:Transcript_16330/g.35494  ORF Transcript_16330/g.35494 Transcript_16330/m.35494 type:complete len:1045 (-) Transcript_16330:40-3174(-)
MSRKAREDQTAWKMPLLYTFVGEYGPFKTKRYEPINNTLVWLCNGNSNGNSTKREEGRHPMFSLAGPIQQELLFRGSDSNTDSERFSTVLVVDISDMFDAQDDYEEALAKEIEQVDLTKRFGKKMLRLFQKLLLQGVIVAAQGELCVILLKLYQAIQKMDDSYNQKGDNSGSNKKKNSNNNSNNNNTISELWLLDPKLSPKYVNTHLVMDPNNKNNKYPVQLNVVRTSSSSKSSSNRISVLKHFFPVLGTELVIDNQDNGETMHNWFSVIAQRRQHKHQRQNQGSDASPPEPYDSSICNDLGKMLFVSQMKVAMDRYSKQYERTYSDVTSELPLIAASATNDHENEESTALDRSAIDWSACERHVGALILRGNRCVLARSLSKQWTGMRIPSLVPKQDETTHAAAIRAATEFTGVDASELKPLPHILPVAVYAPNGRSILVELYPLYAKHAPPDGPLEDADMEDDETPYDWYTYTNAIAKLDKSSVTALQNMALNLVQAANVGLVPAKWGGVFGQEFQLQGARAPGGTSTETKTKTATEERQNHTSNGNDNDSSLMLLEATVEEWKPTRQGDILQDVRKANTALEQKINTRKGHDGKRSAKLPVTLLSGFLGSGKTTLLSHILSNYEGLKVAILVNDMGEINIDAALIKSTVSVRQREEHMVELSNGCICCTLREDLLVEVASIAADTSIDYLLIESTGVSEPMPVAETFTFEDSTGLRLGDIAEIDTLVTVVDGSRFMTEMNSLESLQARNWHADPEDQRTISHLLCDQVEFANVIVLNKCDLIGEEDQMQVKTLIQKMNPSAKLIESKFSCVPLDSVLGTGLFSMSEAEKHEGWLQEARLGEHTPETEEYGIGSFTYRATRPFLPHKLNQVLEDLLGGSQPPFDSSIVIRAKGFVWLANCSQLQGDFSLAGNHYSLLPGNPWWAEIDKTHWPENLERQIAPLWREPYGDRQQEIVLIGQALNQEAICQAFDQCLVSVDSMKVGQEVWDKIVQGAGDPFAETWDAAIALAQKEHLGSHDHDHNHSHKHNDHDHVDYNSANLVG